MTENKRRHLNTTTTVPITEPSQPSPPHHKTIVAITTTPVSDPTQPPPLHHKSAADQTLAKNRTNKKYESHQKRPPASFHHHYTQKQKPSPNAQQRHAQNEWIETAGN
ncbi:hypothetical protein P8452_63242 [Trifolium repens]|nr:hypothetical protein P8452_63242 [Trifolium repens]